MEASSIEDQRSRIPLSLQAIFLASNRGETVHQPPKDRSASRTFARGGRRWFPRVFRRRRFDKNKKTTFQNSRSEYTTEHDDEDDPHSNSSKSPSPPASPKQTTIGHKKEHVQPNQQQPHSKQTTRQKQSPRDYLNEQLAQRGYSTKTYPVLQSAYRNKPTSLQKASYDSYLIQVVKEQDADEFQRRLTCGLSPNPCNAHSESLLHLVCRLGHSQLLQIQLDAGATVAVSDDFGRTVLHDACWTDAPNFTVIQVLLNRDSSLLSMTDARGSTPLDYVPRRQYGVWMAFLESKLDVHWPERKMGPQPPPPLALQDPDSHPVPDPRHALPLDLARLVASGRMTAQEATLLVQVGTETDDNGSASSCSDPDSDDDSTLSSSFLSDYSEDADSFTLKGYKIQIPQPPPPPPSSAPVPNPTVSRETQRSYSHEKRSVQTTEQSRLKEGAYYCQPDDNGLLDGCC